MNQKKLWTYFSKAVCPASLCHTNGLIKTFLPEQKTANSFNFQTFHWCTTRAFPLISQTAIGWMWCVLRDQRAVAQVVPGSKRHFTSDKNIQAVTSAWLRRRHQPTASHSIFSHDAWILLPEQKVHPFQGRSQTRVIKATSNLEASKYIYISVRTGVSVKWSKCQFI